MTLATAIKRPGFQRLTNSRLELPDLFVSLGFKVGVEVGVYKAGFTEQFAKAGLQIYGVDPFEAYEGYSTQERQDFLWGHVHRVLDKYPNCTLIRKRSMDAVLDFPEESIDFVYIDGNHGFKYAAEDLWEWTKRVKKGGVISGHDYMQSTSIEIKDPYAIHVRHVVDGWIKTFKIQDWIVFNKGDRSDRWPNYLWIKQ